MVPLTCGILNKTKQKVNLIETENRIVVTRGGCEGEMERCRSKGTNFQLQKNKF